MFEIMSKAIDDNKPPKMHIVEKFEDGKEIIKEIQPESKLQIIVLDHAGEDVWGNIKGKENIHHLPEWTDKNPLVPLEWIKTNN